MYSSGTNDIATCIIMDVYKAGRKIKLSKYGFYEKECKDKFCICNVLAGSRGFFQPSFENRHVLVF